MQENLYFNHTNPIGLQIIRYKQNLHAKCAAQIRSSIVCSMVKNVSLVRDVKLPKDFSRPASFSRRTFEVIVSLVAGYEESSRGAPNFRGIVTSLPFRKQAGVVSN